MASGTEQFVEHEHELCFSNDEELLASLAEDACDVVDEYQFADSDTELDPENFTTSPPENTKVEIPENPPPKDQTETETPTQTPEIHTHNNDNNNDNISNSSNNNNNNNSGRSSSDSNNNTNKPGAIPMYERWAALVEKENEQQLKTLQKQQQQQQQGSKRKVEPKKSYEFVTGERAKAFSAIGSGKTSQEKKDSQRIEEFSGHLIRDARLSAEEMTLCMQEKQVVSFNKIPRLTTQLSGSEAKANLNWVTFAVIVGKLEPKYTKKGDKYQVWKVAALGDLVLGLFLFRECFDAHWRAPIGSLIAVLNPEIMLPVDGQGSISLSVGRATQLLVVGTSCEYGQCKASKPDGAPCNAPINAKRGPLCAFHMQKQYRSMKSNRMELASSNGFMKGSPFEASHNNAFRNKLRTPVTAPLAGATSTTTGIIGQRMAGVYRISGEKIDLSGDYHRLRRQRALAASQRSLSSVPMDTLDQLASGGKMGAVHLKHQIQNQTEQKLQKVLDKTMNCKDALILSKKMSVLRPVLGKDLPATNQETPSKLQSQFTGRASTVVQPNNKRQREIEFELDDDTIELSVVAKLSTSEASKKAAAAPTSMADGPQKRRKTNPTSDVSQSESLRDTPDKEGDTVKSSPARSGLIMPGKGASLEELVQRQYESPAKVLKDTDKQSGPQIAYKCTQCNKITEAASTLCMKRLHKIELVKVAKQDWICSTCCHRISILETTACPIKPCPNCGSTIFRKTK